MKRAPAVILCTLLLSSCTSNMIDPTLKDGVYTARGDPWMFGQEEATLTVRSGRITGVVLRKLDAAGSEIDYKLWNGMSIDGTVRPDLEGARFRLSDSIIQKQSFYVDTISGSTISSSNWKTAVRRALDKAR